MNSSVTIQETQEVILTIRGLQVMIDADLAQLYGVETKALNQAVKRNIDRFPDQFRFQLTAEEKRELVTNCDRFNSLKHSTSRPYAFTEQGVAMLSAVLRSDTAVKVSIQIMQAFVSMRRFLSDNGPLLQRMETLEKRQIANEIKTVTARLKQDLKKHNAQYPSVAVREFAHSHDRFVIIDGEEVYHLGASLKDLGKKWFAFSRMEKDSLAVMARVEAEITKNLAGVGYEF